MLRPIRGKKLNKKKQPKIQSRQTKPHGAYKIKQRIRRGEEMKRTMVLLLSCLFMANFVYAGNGVFESCMDPDGMIGNRCFNDDSHVEPPPFYYDQSDEVASIRRSGDDTVIIKFGDGHLEDYHRRPDGTWGKGLG